MKKGWEAWSWAEHVTAVTRAWEDVKKPSTYPRASPVTQSIIQLCFISISVPLAVHTMYVEIRYSWVYMPPPSSVVFSPIAFRIVQIWIFIWNQKQRSAMKYDLWTHNEFSLSCCVKFAPFFVSASASFLQSSISRLGRNFLNRNAWLLMTIVLHKQSRNHTKFCCKTLEM